MLPRKGYIKTMENAAATKPSTSTRKPALFTVKGFNSRTTRIVDLGRIWAKYGTANTFMARVDLGDYTYTYAKATSKEALVEWVKATSPLAKSVKHVACRRTYNGYWDKVECRRIERQFTATCTNLG